MTTTDKECIRIFARQLKHPVRLDLITTAPGVRYRITTQKGEVMEIHNPSKLPEPNEIALFEEPMIKAMILTNDDYVGPILKLAEISTLHVEVILPTSAFGQVAIGDVATVRPEAPVGGPTVSQIQGEGG